MTTRRYLYPLLLAALLCGGSGCIPEETPIAPYDRGNANETLIPMGADYGTQVYFDVETATIVKQNPVTEWDIAFRSENGFQVVLNESKITAAMDLGPVDFETAQKSGEPEWRYDDPVGGWDSTAIGTWWGARSGEEAGSKGHVYLIDRGITAAGKKIGTVKLMILSADADEYTIRFAHMDGTGDRTMTVPRDPTVNIVGLSFDGNGSVVEVEPPKGTWDLLFTRYMHIFREPEFTPYSVTGILLNPYGTIVAVDTVRSFEEVASIDPEAYEFSDRPDAIGYDWKTYDLQQGTYSIDSPIYIMQDSKGFYYKMELLDFYNKNGERGYPTIRTQKL